MHHTTSSPDVWSIFGDDRIADSLFSGVLLTPNISSMLFIVTIVTVYVTMLIFVAMAMATLFCIV